MLALTEYGLALLDRGVTAGGYLGQAQDWLRNVPPSRPTYQGDRAEAIFRFMTDLAETLQAAIRRNAPESETLPLRLQIAAVADELRAELLKPAASHSECADVLEHKRSIARRIRFGSRALVELSMEILRPDYKEPCPPPSETSEERAPVLEWIKKNWLLLAGAAAIILLLSVRGRGR